MRLFGRALLEPAPWPLWPRSEEEWREILSAEAYAVLREARAKKYGLLDPFQWCFVVVSSPRRQVVVLSFFII